MRVIVISDLHVDYKENGEWLCALSSSTDFLDDILLVAGDVTHQLGKLRETLMVFKTLFREVFFVPGNHELWILGKDKETMATSMDKFEAILTLCAEVGVHTSPKRIPFSYEKNDNEKPSEESPSPQLSESSNRASHTKEEAVWIVPLFSWYSPLLEAQPPQFNVKEETARWMDFTLCKWSREHLNDEPLDPLAPSGSPSKYFLKLNERFLEEIEFDAPVISFSHFLPRRDCLPPSSVLFVPLLPYVSGDPLLDVQIKRLKPRLHAFGHTHINWDITVDGTRYFQRSLKYPKERERMNKMFAQKGGEGESRYATTNLADMAVYDSTLPDPFHINVKQ